MIFGNRVPSIGKIIAENIDAHPEQWSFGSGFPLPFTNEQEGWTILLCETWAGDDLSLKGIPLRWGEAGKLWGAIGRFRQNVTNGKRDAALRRYFCNAAQGIDTRSGVARRVKARFPKGNAPMIKHPNPSQDRVEELKPCPFCGEKVVEEIGVVGHHIDCDNGCPLLYNAFGVDEWNTRPESESVTVNLDDLPRDEDGLDTIEALVLDATALEGVKAMCEGSSSFAERVIRRALKQGNLRLSGEALARIGRSV